MEQPVRKFRTLPEAIVVIVGLFFLLPLPGWVWLAPFGSFWTKVVIDIVWAVGLIGWFLGEAYDPMTRQTWHRATPVDRNRPHKLGP